MTEDDLIYYYEVVETLWFGGSGPTFERIRHRVRPPDDDDSRLATGLATLVERKWLKLQQVATGAWSTETLYENLVRPYPAPLLGRRHDGFADNSR